MEDIKYEIIKTSLGTVRKIKDSDFYVLIDIVNAIGLYDSTRIAKKINQQYIKKLDFKKARQYGLAPGYRGIFLVNKDGIKQFSGITSHKLKAFGIFNELNLNDDIEIKAGIESFEGHKVEYIELNGEMLYELYSTATALKQTNSLCKERMDKYISENDVKLFNYNGQRYLTKAMLNKLVECMLGNKGSSDYQAELIKKEVRPMEINNQIQIFEDKEFGKVRWVVIKNKPYAVGKDVATALEYKSPKDAISRHCKGAISYRLLTNGGNQEVKVIPQGDIFRLIIKAADQSKSLAIKEKAERFEVWVFDDILPTINRTGGYIQQGKEEKFINNYFANLSEETKKMMIKDLQAKNQELENKGIEIARQIKNNNEVLTQLKGVDISVK